MNHICGMWVLKFSNRPIDRKNAKVQTVATIARSATPRLFVLQSKIYKTVEPKLR